MTTNNQKEENTLIWLCAFIYFISYITRINYGAIIAEMVTSTGLLKSTLSWALTGSFITYGLGQTVSGYFGDKFQPRLLVSLGLITSSLMNICIPFCPGPVSMTSIWCVNGFAQAFMWPPLVKLMSSRLEPQAYNRATVKVAWGSSFGTMFIYLVAPVIIAVTGWKFVFWFCALMGIFGLLLWRKFCPPIDMQATSIQKKTVSAPKNGSLITPLVVFIMLAIVLQGIVRDGVTTWMPSFIAETYHLSNEISILTGIILPVFSILCFQAAERLYDKKFKNPLSCSAVIFGIGTASGLLLYLLSNKNAAASVFLSALMTGCMHGVNLVLLCILPPLLAEKGRVSAISGILNTCTYIGSALSTYLIPLVTEATGNWSTTLLLWLLAVVLGTVICFACIPAWKKRTAQKSEQAEQAC